MVAGGCLAPLILSAQAPSAVSGRVSFREPSPATYRLEASDAGSAAGTGRDWIRAWPDRSRYPVELGSRVVLQLKPGADLQAVLEGTSLQLSRRVGPDLYVLQARDAASAVAAAQRLARRADALAGYPVERRGQLRLHGPYAPAPNDMYFFDQWNLENRDANGVRLGADLNARAAWSVTRGERTIIAIADDGVELTHPDLASRAVDGLHYNFFAGTTNAMPGSGDNHSTAVAGLAIAQDGNQRGMSGMAPAAGFASWKIFAGQGIATDEQRMDMYQYHSNVVSVENHSWGNADLIQVGPTALEAAGISNAVELGRGGRGVIMVRSAGNGRGNLLQSGDANDDGFANDPRTICVASVNRAGRAAVYSNRGACLLVAAPGGDSDGGVFTTDRQGSAAGFNMGVYTNDFADYLQSTDIVGTSFSAPQISGLAALVLSVNTNLYWRDVQQILVLASRHFDLADPDLQTNGAGFRVSHNVGFGVPDAGRAIRLARSWVNRPATSAATVAADSSQAIPDDGLRVLITSSDPRQPVPAGLESIGATPSMGPHPDVPTAVVPLVDVGYATNDITVDLTGKAALIQRGPSGEYPDQRNHFDRKIQRAAAAGATFAVVYNNAGGEERMIMGGTDFVPIPAVFIGQNEGLALQSYIQSAATALAGLQFTPARYSLEVTNSLVCEHVSVRLKTDHPRRGDLRVTLLSPRGTRSVLQTVNYDDGAGPADWTYRSTLLFGEAAAGTWTLDVGDEQPLNNGSVQSVELTIEGVAIHDTDKDGLDDDWELAHFGSLAAGPREDPDGDGLANAVEQLLSSDPNSAEAPFTLDLSPWDARLTRLSWPGSIHRNYEILGSATLDAPLTVLTNVPGAFPETEWFSPYTNLVDQFFRVREAGP